MDSYAAIIDLWPSIEEFAADIGVKPGFAKLVKSRNSVPARFWRAMVRGAARRGISGVSLEVLAQLAERRFSDRRSSAQPPAATGAAA